jgi:hypothetical protein
VSVKSRLASVESRLVGNLLSLTYMNLFNKKTLITKSLDGHKRAHSCHATNRSREEEVSTCLVMKHCKCYGLLCCIVNIILQSSIMTHSRDAHVVTMWLASTLKELIIPLQKRQELIMVWVEISFEKPICKNY